jgi:hypothetical protein
MAEQLAVPNDKKKHVLKINFDKICCSVFSKVIHASQTTSEMCVTDILLNGTEDQTEDSGISRKVFFDILSCSNPNFSKLSSDTLYDEGLKRQHGSLGFQSSDGRLRLSPQYCSDLIREFVLDGAPGHAPSIQLQRARQTVLDALTTFWMRNGKLIETKLRETQITAARLAETMHSFFKGYFQKENTLSLWILTRSMISDLNLGKIIAERTRNPENAAVTKIKSTVQKLMMVSLISITVSSLFYSLHRFEDCVLLAEVPPEFHADQDLLQLCFMMHLRIQILFLHLQSHFTTETLNQRILLEICHHPTKN